MKKDEWLSIGEIAEIAGIRSSTLRYYESIGLLPRPKRVGGQRRYTTAILSLLAIIEMAKQANFSLPEIHTLLHPENNNEMLSQRWKTLANDKIQELEAVIERAKSMKALLEESLHSTALHFELDHLESTEQPRIRN